MRIVPLTFLALAACNGPMTRDDGGLDASTRDLGTGADASGTDASALDASGTDAGGTDAGAPATAAEIRAALGTCARLAGTTDFATDVGAADTVTICDGPVPTLHWDSDLDVDCDGGRSAICMSDPSYLPDTSATDSAGNPIDAATVPFIVIPLSSNGFDYAAHGIALGQVAVVLYGGTYQYGVFADEGPRGIIGEASYAMASDLGIDPDPITGGADSGATFVVFTGAANRVAHVENHAEAVTIGTAQVSALLGH